MFGRHAKDAKELLGGHLGRFLLFDDHIGETFTRFSPTQATASTLPCCVTSAKSVLFCISSSLQRQISS